MAPWLCTEQWGPRGRSRGRKGRKTKAQKRPECGMKILDIYLSLDVGLVAPGTLMNELLFFKNSLVSGLPLRPQATDQEKSIY